MTPRRGRAVGAVTVGLVLLVGLSALALLGLARLVDRPATVRPDFRPPTELPVGPPLPADELVFDADRSGTFELYRMPIAGGTATRLTDDPTTDAWWPRLSPDRRTILFYRTPAGVHDRDFAQTALWAIASDGGEPLELRPAGLDGWTFQGHAEWSPDGTQLVMFGGSRLSPQIHVTDALGQAPRAVTDRPGTNLDPSWSPDGSEIVFVGCPQSICTETDQEVYRVPVGGGDAQRLTDDDRRDHDPYLSPDGRVLVRLVQTAGGLPGSWDVLVSDADGGGAQPLAGDEGITSRAVFTPEGTTLLVHRMAPGGDRFRLYAASVGIEADGALQLGPLTPLPGSDAGNDEYPSP